MLMYIFQRFFLHFYYCNWEKKELFTWLDFMIAQCKTVSMKTVSGKGTLLLKIDLPINLGGKYMSKILLQINYVMIILQT